MSARWTHTRTILAVGNCRLALPEKDKVLSSSKEKVNCLDLLAILKSTGRETQEEMTIYVDKNHFYHPDFQHLKRENPISVAIYVDKSALQRLFEDVQPEEQTALQNNPQ